MTHLLERQTGEAFHEFLWIDCIIIILVEETLDILPNTKVLDKLLSYTSCKGGLSDPTLFLRVQLSKELIKKLHHFIWKGDLEENEILWCDLRDLINLQDSRFLGSPSLAGSLVAAVCRFFRPHGFVVTIDLLSFKLI